MYPYKNTKHHFLLLHKEHIDRLDKITPKEQNELMELVTWAIKKFKIPGGTLLMRFGETRYTGASVSHLHAQLISSDPDAKEYEPVLTRVG